jgi:hypothetical protein
MSGTSVDAVARALLYEGYMLYPYRPSAVKNQHRFNFGVLYPRAYSDAQAGTDAWFMRTECPLRTDAEVSLDVTVRFLQTLRSATSGTWQEAVEREVVLEHLAVTELGSSPSRHRFEFLGTSDGTANRMPTDSHNRFTMSIQGDIEVSAANAGPGIVVVGVGICNTTPLDAAAVSRDDALMQSLISTHTILRVTGGTFVSLLDPPDGFHDVVASCRNVGTWPVLAGEEHSAECMLSSPIILYDYPQIAPESAGDLFDGTEIDEILALRILTLTDEEKREIRQSDDRAREMLERTEALPVEHLKRLHGAIRGLRSTPKQATR